jgi:homoserine kinase
MPGPCPGPRISSELSTEQSRQALPRSFDLHATLAFAENLAGFLHALETGDRELLRRCLRDPLAEPYRAGLIPGFREAQAAALEAGAWGCTLSGSGPAIFAVAESPEQAGDVADALRGGLLGAGLGSTVRLCRLDLQGSRVLAP